MKSRKDVMDTLETILKWYECERSDLDFSMEDAVRRTLSAYSDFYDWLCE